MRALAHPEWVAKGQVAFEQKHPEFLAAYRRALETPEPCDRCGGEARPIINRDSHTLLAWRCYACRQVGPS